MAEIYVSPTGSDTSGDGSQSNPYQHIYYAIDQANDGDTIICLPGTYHEDEGRVITDKSLTIQSSSGNFEDVIIIIDGEADGYYQGAWLVLQMTDKTLTIKNVTLKWGSADHSYTNVFIAGDQNSPNIEVVGCFFDGTNMPTHSAQYGVGGRRGNSLKVYKSTFRHFKHPDSSDRNAIRTWDVSWSIEVRDTIFEDCQRAIYNESGTVDSDYNCYYNNDTNIYNGSLGSHDITSDPQFTGTDTAEIQETSPCRDAGIVITGYVESYTGDAPEIGSYEFLAIIKISGQVTLNGNPVQGAKVRAICQDDNSYAGDATTDENGNYEIVGLDKTKKYHIIVEYTDGSGNKYNAESKWDITPIEIS